MRDFRPNAKPASRPARVRTPKSTQKPNPNVTQTRSLDSCGKYFRTVALVVAAGSLAARMPWENAVRGREGVTRLQKRSCLSPLNPTAFDQGNPKPAWLFALSPQCTNPHRWCTMVPPRSRPRSRRPVPITFKVLLNTLTTPARTRACLTHSLLARSWSRMTKSTGHTTRR